MQCSLCYNRISLRGTSYCLWVSLLSGYSTTFDLSPAEAIKKDCTVLGESTCFVACLSLTSKEDNCIRGHLRMEMKKLPL